MKIIAIKNYKWDFIGRIKNFSDGAQYFIESDREAELMIKHGYAAAFQEEEKKAPSKSVEKRLDVQTENKMMDSPPENKGIDKKSSKRGRPRGRLKRRGK